MVKVILLGMFAVSGMLPIGAIDTGLTADRIGPPPQGFTCRWCEYDYFWLDHIMITGGSGFKNTSGHGTHDGQWAVGSCQTHTSCGYAMAMPLDSLTKKLARLDLRAAKSAIVAFGARAVWNETAQYVDLLTCDGAIGARVSFDRASARRTATD